MSYQKAQARVVDLFDWYLFFFISQSEFIYKDTHSTGRMQYLFEGASGSEIWGDLYLSNYS